MLDHTYNGTPIRKMALEDVIECLEVGFKVNDDDGCPDAGYWIRLRLEIELVIRSIEIAGA